MTSESLALFLLLIQVSPPGAVSNFSSSLFPSQSSPNVCVTSTLRVSVGGSYGTSSFFALFAPSVPRREIFQQSPGDKRGPI